MHEANEAYRNFPLKHYVGGISYQMRIAESPNKFIYSGLSGIYFEQPVGEGIRGLIHFGKHEKISFQAPADFAKAEIMMKEEYSRKQYDLKIDFSLLKSEYPSIYQLPVLQYGRTNATIDSGGLFRSPGNICWHLAGNMACEFPTNLIDAAGFLDMLDRLCDNIGSHEEMVKAVNAELLRKNIYPEPLDENTTSTETIVYVRTWLFPGIYWDGVERKC